MPNNKRKKTESQKAYDKKNFKYQTVLFKVEELEAINQYCEDNGIAKNAFIRQACMQCIDSYLKP